MLNLGILAHVDAGKTTLTERLLYAAGVIDEIGRVDHGTTQTDSLELERQRGITIKSAVVSFAIDGVTVNLIDTPGHPDFIAEVERVLGVLDGAVLVISAVEGVQAQTLVLFRALRRLRVPTVIFVNKIDRVGADADRVLDAIVERLTPGIAVMGSSRDVGTRDVGSRRTRGRMRRSLTRSSRRWRRTTTTSSVRTWRVIRCRSSACKRSSRRRPRRCWSIPCTSGPRSPAWAWTTSKPESRSSCRPRRPTATRSRPCRAWSSRSNVPRPRRRSRSCGCSRGRSRPGTGSGCAWTAPAADRVTGIQVYEAGGLTERRATTAGEIARVHGLTSARIGDTFGDDGRVGTAHATAPRVLAPDARDRARPRATRGTSPRCSPPCTSSRSRTR